jgi:hypothetical protein
MNGYKTKKYLINAHAAMDMTPCMCNKLSSILGIKPFCLAKRQKKEFSQLFNNLSLVLKILGLRTIGLVSYLFLSGFSAGFS